MNKTNARLPSKILVIVRELDQLRTQFSWATDANPDLRGKQVASLRALALGNELFDRLTGWAQAHVTGQAMLDDDLSGLKAHLESDLGADFDKTEHFHERLGSVFKRSSSTDHGDAIESALARYQETNKILGSVAEEDLPDLISDVAIRKVAVSVLKPSAKLGSPWRTVLIDALEKLDDGQVPTLFKNPKTPRRTRPADRKRLQIQIIKRIWFEIGRGAAVGKAQEMIGQALGLEPEALRKWEASLRKSPDISNEFDCAELSGKHRHLVQSIDIASEKSLEIFGTYNGIPKAKTALYILFEIVNMPILNLKKQMRYLI